MTLVPPSATPCLVASEPELRETADAAVHAQRLALDIEASGMHSYRARICTIQLAWAAGTQVRVVDALATPLSSLGPLLGPSGPIKIVHDVAFDARLLADVGFELRRVHDTAIAARMLGRAATGLSALLEAELGVRIDKSLQHHDWRIRPIDDPMLAYLIDDVLHIEALERRLWQDLTEKGIEEAVMTETEYRIDCALAAAAPASDDGVRARPAYLGVKGADRLNPGELAALRSVFPLREREAQTRDVPPHRVLSAEALIALSRSRPTTRKDAERIRGVPANAENADFLDRVIAALAAAGDHVPAEEWQALRPIPPASDLVRTRRAKEARLLAWRRAEARRRAVDEQVVLPGHCLKDAIHRDVSSVDDVARIPGIGRFRVESDGEAIVRTLLGADEGLR